MIFRRFAEASGQGFGMADARWVHHVREPDAVPLVGREDAAGLSSENLCGVLCPPITGNAENRRSFPRCDERESGRVKRRLFFRDGRRIRRIFTVFPVRDESGELLRTAVVITDITELKRAEEDCAERSEVPGARRVVPGRRGHGLISREGSSSPRSEPPNSTGVLASRRIDWQPSDGLCGRRRSAKVQGEYRSLDRRGSTPKRRVHVASQRRDDLRCRSLLGGHAGCAGNPEALMACLSGHFRAKESRGETEERTAGTAPHGAGQRP